MRLISGPNQFLIRSRFPALWIVLGIACCTAGTNAQQSQQFTLSGQVQGRVKIRDDQGFIRAQLNASPGTVLEEGSNDQTVGRYLVASYRIEEVNPPVALQGEINGNAVLLEKVWRITITGGPFDLRAAPAVIWIDGEPVGFGAESPDLKSVSTIIYDRSLLKSGSTLSLSYGLDANDRSVLPEKIRISRTR